jgi:hypothetical protein
MVPQTLAAAVVLVVTMAARRALFSPVEMVVRV